MNPVRMTPNESGAFACLIDGLGYKRAAAALGCTQDAYMLRLRNIRRKLGAKTTAQMIALVLEREYSSA